MSAPSISSVERLCIDAIEVSDNSVLLSWLRVTVLGNSLCDVLGIRSVGHQAVGVTERAGTIYDLLNDLQEPKTIFIIEMDILSSISTTYHVVEGTPEHSIRSGRVMEAIQQY